ncbi:MAG: Fibronectin, type [Acidobacteria bacterium]|nr:Fibronectin, type [Acidobacteriota bacterium]
MAKKKTAAAEIDWYLISIDRLKQIGLVVLILLLAGGGYWFYNNQKGSPRSQAESAVADARQSLNSIAAAPAILNAHRADFDRAQKKLEEATALLASTKYPEAQGLAIESQTISRGALSGTADRENDAQFLTVEGEVQFQKSSTSDWKHADVRMPLFNGDWVKTGENASAELIFSNGSLYTIGPNALLEIYAAVNPSTSKKTNAVQMQVGSVEVATTDDASTVKTPGSQVVIDSESTTQVGVTSDKATAVITMKGTASVTSTTGGEAVRLNSGEKISATQAGALSAVRKLNLPPALLTPGDNQLFQVTESSRVDFLWEPAPGAVAYQLQVSRSRLFPTLEINVRRKKPSASAHLTAEGVFYWRVASIGPDGEIGPFSPFRRFRAGGATKSGVGSAAAPADAKPPKLELKRPYGLGGAFFMIEGTTDPGSTVFINNEEVDVEANGHFKKLVSLSKIGRNDVVVKAVNPAGMQSAQTQTVLVNEE